MGQSESRTGPAKRTRKSAKPQPPPADISCNGALFSQDAWRHLTRSLDLSVRESEVARFIFADCTETKIAECLGISHHTVRTHSERLYRKLGVGSRVELVVRLVDEFLRLTRDPKTSLPPICSNRTIGRCPFMD
jgi:DNA-binding CsgD family transcriptional regulator